MCACDCQTLSVAHGRCRMGARLWQVKQDLPGAEKCYSAAIEADPDDKDAARRLAKVIFPQLAMLF